MSTFLKTTKGKIIVIGIALALILAAVVLVIVLQPKDEYRSIVVKELEGSVLRSNDKEQNTTVYAGMALFDGDRITVAEGAKLTIELDGDKYMLAEGGTAFRLEATGKAGSERTVIHLESGSALNRIKNKLNAEQSYVVKTPTSTISVRGTVYQVAVTRDESGQPMTQCATFDGVVEMTPMDENGVVTEQPESVAAGFSATVATFAPASTGDAATVAFVRTPTGGAVEEIDYNAISPTVIEELVEYIADGEELDASREQLEQYVAHEHTFAEDAWSHNDTEHWHDATCEHTDLPSAIRGSVAKHSWSKEVIREATHTLEGEMHYTCTVCGATKTEPIAKTVEHTWSNWIGLVGEDHHTRQCRCGETEEANHAWDAGKITTPATHTLEGVKTYTCTDCEATKTEPIAKVTGHTLGDWQECDDTTDRHCRFCTVCQSVESFEYEAHSYGQWLPEQDNTEYHSRTCKCTKTERDRHTFDDGVAGTDLSGASATVYTCTDCGYKKYDVTEYSFCALVETAGGLIHFNNVAQPNGYQAEIAAGGSVTLKAAADTGYAFAGWYTATNTPVLISNLAEYTFTVTEDTSVWARFEVVVTALSLDGANAGFQNGKATYTIGDQYPPIPENVLVYGITVAQPAGMYLTKDTDYTVDLGGLDLVQAGTYTVTYTYKKNTAVQATLTVEVVPGNVEVNLTYEGPLYDSNYNGGWGTHIYYDSIQNNGQTADLDALNLLYEWRDHETKLVVQPARDDTCGKDAEYFPAPAVSGTYDFVVYRYEEEGSTEKTDLLTVTRTIVNNRFGLVEDPAYLDGLKIYTFIAKVGNDYYAMKSPLDGTPRAEREAVKVEVDENGVVSIGANYEYAFRVYNSNKPLLGELKQYYFRTGMGPYQAGTIVLWGSGGIDYYTQQNADYTLTIASDNEGSVKVASPYCEGVLRLVYDAETGKYLFTAKVGEDARASYPVYLYGEYSDPIPEPQEIYEFRGRLGKEYDGEAVSFNMHKDVEILTANQETLDDLLKMGTGRFVWADAKGGFLSEGTPTDEGTVTGPTDCGAYQLLFQTSEKGKDGPEWVSHLLYSFEIYDADE